MMAYIHADMYQIQGWEAQRNEYGNSFPNLIYKCNAILVKIPTGFFPKLDNLVAKSMLENKRPEIISLKKKNLSYKTSRPTHSKVLVMKP